MSTIVFQPMVLPTTPTMAKPLQFEHPGAKFRGASVEDLQLPPAFALSQNQPVAKAIELAYERDFSYIPILNRQRKPLGYIDVGPLKTAWEAGEINDEVKVTYLANRFDRSSATGRPYTVITPDTPLEDLEEFLKTNVFALVTDSERQFVLGVATSQDVENFVTRRGKNAI